VKAIYKASDCEFCRYLLENFAANVSECDDYVEGRCYTIVEKWKVTVGPVTGYGVRTAEVPLPPHWGSCSCNFREIDGDKDGLKRIMRENRPKVKEPELV